MSLSSTGAEAISEWRTRNSASPTISTSEASPASRSRVALIDPSSEFSIGTTAHTSSPARNAITVS